LSSVLLKQKFFFFPILLVHLWSSGVQRKNGSNTNDSIALFKHRKEKRNGRQLPAVWPFFCSYTSIYTTTRRERQNINIIRLLTAVVVTTDKRKIFFYCVYTINHKHEENFISFYYISSHFK